MTRLMATLQPVIQRVQTCYACRRMDHCHVLGVANGPADAEILFVGEAPGRLGAGRSGVPFSGDESGRRFETLLAVAGLRREDVFITNAVLCNPLDASGRNRPPLRSEVTACLPHLRDQIDAVQPTVVVALGSVALDALRRIEAHDLTLAASCGRPVAWYGRRLVALYHPGRRAIVHRPEAIQVGDWLAVGRFVRMLDGAPRA